VSFEKLIYQEMIQSGLVPQTVTPDATGGLNQAKKPTDYRRVLQRNRWQLGNLPLSAQLPTYRDAQ
jgi:hypothetical protein